MRIHTKRELLLRAHHWWTGSRSLNLLNRIESRVHWSRQQLLNYQFAQLSRLLAEAESHVPYYRELFRSMGITSRDVRSLNDFRMLPVLTKDIVRERAKDLVRNDVDILSLAVGHSGGSTGIPLSFYHDDSYDDAAEAGTFRNLLQCGWKPGETILWIWGGNDRVYSMQAWEWELRQWAQRAYMFDPFHSSAEEMDKWHRRLLRIEPSVIIGYASTVSRFAAHLKSKALKVPGLKGVFTTAEKLYFSQREIISEVFVCPVIDCYGSSEIRNIAGECTRGRMHVYIDYVVLEEERIATHDSSQFVVTSLCNSIMPFIRYRNDDCGKLLDGDCECGSGFPLMGLDIARTSDNFVFPSGRIVHGEFLTHLMYGAEGVTSFQFHQTSLNSIVLWIVPQRGKEKERDHSVRQVVEKLKTVDSTTHVQVDVRLTDVIPLSRLGKHRFVRSDVHTAMPASELGVSNPAV
jgi:phenylacetate-CoA ligase